MANGFFLGGAAEGIESGRKLDLEKRALGLREKALEADAERNLMAQADEHIAGTMKVVSETIKASREAGKSPDAIRRSVAPLLKDAGEIASRIGRDPTRLANQVEALLSIPLKPEKSAAAKGQEAAQAKIAEAKTLVEGAGLTGEDASSALTNILLPQGKQGEFLSLLGALKDTEPGSPEHEAIRGRVNRLSESGSNGFQIQVTPDGGVTVSQGKQGEQQNIPDKLRITGSKADDLRASKSMIDTGVTVTEALIGEIDRDPTKFGAVGTVRRAGESATGIAEDVAKTGLSIAGIDAGRLAKGLANIVQVEKDRGTPNAVADSLKPSTTRATDVFSKALTYSVARAMQPEGRLLAGTVEAASDMVKITGARGSRQVKDQLQAILNLLKSQSADVQRRLESGVTGKPTTPRQEPSLGNEPSETTLDDGTVIRQIR